MAFGLLLHHSSFFFFPPPPPPPPPPWGFLQMAENKAFTLSQVSVHSSKQDCWVIIHGKVYDVTKFLEEHPGGEDVLIQVSGRDATEAFEEIGHSVSAISLMSNYLVGVAEKGSDGDEDEDEMEEKAGLATKKLQETKTSSSMSFFELILPLLVIGLALAWYFYSKN
ncbi:cytochrome b5, seed isoform-like [Tasmannia lanceolata]|uniref:cytochrome b5, seed isoform-like n=1 Tax=Tasmannia lanceolata TaxID=3420 RepID=UPI004063AB88